MKLSKIFFEYLKYNLSFWKIVTKDGKTKKTASVSPQILGQKKPSSIKSHNHTPSLHRAKTSLCLKIPHSATSSTTASSQPIATQGRRKKEERINSLSRVSTLSWTICWRIGYARVSLWFHLSPTIRLVPIFSLILLRGGGEIDLRKRNKRCLKIEEALT